MLAHCDSDIVKYLSLREFLSSLTAVATHFYLYPKKSCNVSVLKQLICYDFPLIFTLCPRLIHQMESSKSNIHLLISKIYNNIHHTVKIPEIAKVHYSFQQGLLTETEMHDVKLLNNLYSAVCCGGICGLKYYIKLISEIKQTSIANLYFCPTTKPIEDSKPHDLKNGILSISVPTIKHVNDIHICQQFPTDKRNTCLLQLKYIKKIFEVYLGLFDINGIVHSHYSKNYVDQFYNFLLKEAAPFYSTIHDENTLSGILEIALIQNKFHLFDICISSLFHIYKRCEPILHVTTDDINYHPCSEFEHIIFRTIIQLSDKDILQICYDKLDDPNWHLCKIISKLNAHSMTCYEATNDIGIQFGPLGVSAECIDKSLARKIAIKYEKLLPYMLKYMSQNTDGRYVDIDFLENWSYYGIPTPLSSNGAACFEWRKSMRLLLCELNNSPVIICAATENWSAFCEVVINCLEIQPTIDAIMMIAEHINNNGITLKQKQVIIEQLFFIMCCTMYVCEEKLDMGTISFYQLHMAYLMNVAKKYILSIVNKSQRELSEILKYYFQSFMKRIKDTLIKEYVCITQMLSYLQRVKSHYEDISVEYLRNAVMAKQKHKTIDANYRYHYILAKLGKNINNIARIRYYCLDIYGSNQLYFTILSLIHVSKICYDLGEYRISLRSLKYAFKLCCLNKMTIINPSFVKYDYRKKRKSLKKKLKLMICSYCKQQKSYNLRPCTGCMKEVYCNKRCQKQGWNRIHRLKCNKEWSKMYPPFKYILRNLSKRTIVYATCEQLRIFKHAKCDRHSDCCV
eukprot:504666_1